MSAAHTLRVPLRLFVPVLCLSLLSPALVAAGEGDVAPIDSAIVDTDLRTLRGCPLKALVTRAEDWQRVVDGLAGAPPAPDFQRLAAAVVVVEVPPGGQVTLEEVELAAAKPGGGQELRVVLQRHDPDPPQSGLPTLRCCFFFLPAPAGGIVLDYRTQVWGGTGYVSRLILPRPQDRDPACFPALGPDVRLQVAPPPGQALPPQLSLREEATFANQPELERRVLTNDWPQAGAVPLGLRFPRVHGVEHLLAAHAPGLRSRNPLRILTLPAPDASGSPPPIVHTFQLEPVPE